MIVTIFDLLQLSILDAILHCMKFSITRKIQPYVYVHVYTCTYKVYVPELCFFYANANVKNDYFCSNKFYYTSKLNIKI